MPKQIFQRPAPVNHTKIPNKKGSPFGQDGWNRKKGKKPEKVILQPTDSKTKQK